MNKNQIYNLIIITILFVLIIVRLFDDIDISIISEVNYIGMIVAFISIMFKIHFKAKENSKPIWTFIIVVSIIVSVIFGVLILLQKIVLSTKVNGVITLLALLFSIPADLFVALFSSQQRKNNQPLSNK